MEVKHGFLLSSVTFFHVFSPIVSGPATSVSSPSTWEPSAYHIVASVIVDVISKTSGRVRVALEQVPPLRCLIFGGLLSLLSGSSIVRLARKS